MGEIIALALAVAFAVVTGLNDGGTLASTGVRVRSLSLRQAVVILTVAVAVVPAVLGVAVARTLTERLVGFSGAAGPEVLAVAIVASLAVVGLSARFGLPTSLTLALVGALAGAGVGAGLQVGWLALGIVLLIAALAPVVAAAVARALAWVLRYLPVRGRIDTRLVRAHRVSFGLQSIAYGLNDGQKMLAVAALAIGVPVGAAAVSWQAAVLVGSAFAVGTLLGARRYAGTVGGGLLPLRPLRAVTTELSAATAVLGTGLLGAPVSMTQSIVGGIVGVGVSEGAGRVRWRALGRVGIAWAATLPLAFAVAAGLALLVVGSGS